MEDKKANLIATLYQEQIQISKIISDLYFEADLEPAEIDHEMKRAANRRSSLNATQSRLLLAGVSR